MIFDLFGNNAKHPFTDEQELNRALASLPVADSFKAVSEIRRWVVNLTEDNRLRPSQRLFAALKIDEATQLHLQRLTHDYLTTPYLSQSEERSLWEINHGYWEDVAALYTKCLEEIKGKAASESRSMLLLRLIGAMASQNKWICFRYSQNPDTYWLHLGKIYLVAIEFDCLYDALRLYPDHPALTSVHREYLRVILLCASSPDSLLPLGIELVNRLITSFMGDFIFSEQSSDDSVYWIDPASGFPPTRLATLPQNIQPTLRFVAPGTVPLQLAELLEKLDENIVPERFLLDERFSIPLIRTVAQHLALYWAPLPPMRKYPRHRVKNRMSVIHGFSTAWFLYSNGIEDKAESWVVENVSLSGFGALVSGELADWAKIGTLLCIQPEGGENWLLGIVRRCQKRSEDALYLGIQTLSRQVKAIEMKAYAGTEETPVLLLEDNVLQGQVYVIVPRDTFDLRLSRNWQRDSEESLLVPVTLIERGQDFEIACYREYRRGSVYSPLSDGDDGEEVLRAEIE